MEEAEEAMEEMAMMDFLEMVSSPSMQSFKLGKDGLKYFWLYFLKYSLRCTLSMNSDLVYLSTNGQYINLVSTVAPIIT